MSYILALLLLLPVPAPQKQDADTLARGVDQTFAKMRDFSADFIHIYEDFSNRRRQESGHLYLAKDRKMRWQYQHPDEKTFVSNGKTVYFFDAANQQVRKDEAKNISDDQLPLMFLVGRAGLRDQFKQIELFGPGVLRLTPKRKSDIKEIEVEVDPSSYLIHRLVVKTDDSRSEFRLSNIRTNTGLSPDYFEFKVPPGVELIQGLGQ